MSDAPSSSKTSRILTVIFWVAVVGFFVWALVAKVIPWVFDAVDYAGTSGGATTITWIIIWGVAAIAVYFITGLFTDSVGLRLFLSALGLAALAVALVYLVLTLMFSGSTRRP